MLFYEIKPQAFFYPPSQENKWTTDQHELLAILDDWAKQLKKDYLSVRSQSQIHEITENYKKYQSPMDFIMIRNYGKIRYDLYAHEVFEIIKNFRESRT